jgi:hypothetical protein
MQCLECDRKAVTRTNLCRPCYLKEWKQRNNGLGYKLNIASRKATGVKYKTRMIGGHVYKITIDEIIKLQQSPCFFCGIQANGIDHIIPLSRGGNHSVGNLMPCCNSCNSKKGCKLLIEIRKTA